MRIVRVDVYRFTYSLARGTFAMSGGRTATTQDSTIVKVTTDEGLVGWGETCPFSPSYIAAHGDGARAAIQQIGPALLGVDPRHTEIVHARMEQALRGHAYAKSALDMACWDLAGQASGLPLADLLGGTFQTDIPVYIGVSLGPPEVMREDAARLRSLGYRRFQLKAGGTWQEDVARVERCLEALEGAEVVIVDANGFWPQHEAVQVVAALDDRLVYIEQPCNTLAACAAVRQHSRLPFILDESLEGLDDIVAARAAQAMDVARLKLSRFGGVTRVRTARDLCLHWGMATTVEDAGGGDIVAAALTHVAASTRPPYLFDTFLPNTMVNERIADGAPTPQAGTASVPRRPGLGIEVDERLLGTPAYTVG